MWQVVRRQGREGELSSPEALLARIFERLPQPAWVVDNPGVIIFANPAARSALGYRDPVELQGKPSREAALCRFGGVSRRSPLPASR